MSQQIITKCDVCGQVKGQANNWIKYVMSPNPPFLWIGLLELDQIGPASDACSGTCIQKILVQVLDAIRSLPHEDED